jgi:hypothetical protein
MNVVQEAHARLAHNRPLHPATRPKLLALVCILDTVLLARRARVLSAVRRGPKRCCRIDCSHGVHQSHLELAGDR